MLTGFDCYVRKVVENGKPIFPEAFCLTEKDRLELEKTGVKVESIERLKQTNREKFYGQYLNDPLDEENLEFKRHWFQRFTPTFDLADKLWPVPVIISIDPAFKLSQRSDFTGIVVSKTTPDNLVYIIEAKGIKVNPQMLVEEIFRLVDRYKFVEKVLVETVISQVMLLDLLNDEMRKRDKFFVIEEVKPRNNETKTAHIRALIPHYANGRIFHNEGLNALEDQLIEFPKGQHDDIIDALAYQVPYWKAANQSIPVKDIPYGSYAWWKQKTRSSMVLGKLFEDIR